MDSGERETPIKTKRLVHRARAATTRQRVLGHIRRASIINLLEPKPSGPLLKRPACYRWHHFRRSGCDHAAFGVLRHHCFRLRRVEVQPGADDGWAVVARARLLGPTSQAVQRFRVLGSELQDDVEPFLALARISLRKSTLRGGTGVAVEQRTPFSTAGPPEAVAQHLVGDGSSGRGLRSQRTSWPDAKRAFRPLYMGGQKRRDLFIGIANSPVGANGLGGSL